MRKQHLFLNLCYLSHDILTTISITGSRRYFKHHQFSLSFSFFIYFCNLITFFLFFSFLKTPPHFHSNSNTFFFPIICYCKFLTTMCSRIDSQWPQCRQFTVEHPLMDGNGRVQTDRLEHSVSLGTRQCQEYLVSLFLLAWLLQQVS